MRGIKTKVLLISHNVFNERTAMGKTLSAFFGGWDVNCLAQLYFHSEVPTMDICHRYYRITDMDALRSVFRRNKNSVGKALYETAMDTSSVSLGVDTGMERKLYSFGRKRTSYIYCARNTLWRLSGWYSEELKQWIRAFAPDVIFFAAGDYAFAYDVADRISGDFDIPVVMYCCDDYFINRRNPHSLLGLFVYKSFMRSVQKCISRSAAIITICDKMAEAYKTLFDKPVYTIYTGYHVKNRPDVDGKGIVYLGNLGCSRYRSLVDIGRALKNISRRTGEELHLDIYSAENRKEVLGHLTEENGIVFHGAIDSEAVSRMIAESRLVVHTESFAPEDRRKVMYSISTKIADLLASGRCIFAYGPEDVASMEYLQTNHAACVVNAPEKLEEELEDILDNWKRRNTIVESAKRLSEKNHNTQMVQRRLKEVLSSSCAAREHSC